MHDVHRQANKGGAYRPTAIYYSSADSLEYVRNDEPALYRRIDEHLTLILHLATRDMLGFKLKGFRHLYLTCLQPKYALKEQQFLALIDILEDAMRIQGNAIFEKGEREAAYKQAKEMAATDNVQLGVLRLAVSN